MSTRIAHLLVADSLTSFCLSPAFPILGEFNGNDGEIVSDGNEVCNPDDASCALDAIDAEFRRASTIEGADVPALLTSRAGARMHALASAQARPGDKMVVSTTVLVRQFVSASGITPTLTEERSTMHKFPALKIIVNSCGGVDRKMIDPGYSIVVPGPRARVAVVAPIFGGAWDLTRGPPPPFVFEEAWEVMVYARACPARCCYPPLPHLTYFRAVDAGLPNTALTFVVPYGAKSLILGSVPAGPTTLQYWVGDPNTAASVQIGVQPITPAAAFAAPIPIEPFGSPTHILFTPAPTAPGFLFMRWAID